MTNSLPPHLRKAAILIDSLDAHAADVLLQQMGEEQAARVRHAVMQLGDIEPVERQQVLDQFRRGAGAAPPPSTAGVELDVSLASKFGQPASSTAASRAPLPQTAEPPADAVAPGRSLPPFAALREASAEPLGQILRAEHPQTAALVLSHLPPQQAAEVLMSQPLDWQTEILRRVADLDETAPEVLKDVEQHLESLLAEHLRSKRRRETGAANVEAILAAAGLDERARLAAQLTRARAMHTATTHARSQNGEKKGNATANAPSGTLDLERSHQPLTDATPATVAPASEPSADHQLAPQPTVPRATPAEPRPPFPFESLGQLDRPSVLRLLQEADPQVVLLALTGAHPVLVNHLLGPLPSRQAAQLRRMMEQQGPLRLADIETAQRRLADTAGLLIHQGHMQPPGKRHFAAAA